MPNFNTGIVRFSYMSVWEPKPNKSGKQKYSVCALIPKVQGEDVKIYEQKMFEALEEGIGHPKARFTRQQVDATKAAWKSGAAPVIKLPLRDGDLELLSGKKKTDDWKGMMFFNANSDNQPGITKPQDGVAVMISDPLEVYSGCFGRLAVSFYPYNTDGTLGIAVGLNGVYKTGDGDRLDGKVNAVDAFADFAAEDSAASTEGTSTDNGFG